MCLYLIITMPESVSTWRSTIYNVIKFPCKFTVNSMVTTYCFLWYGKHLVIRADSCWSYIIALIYDVVFQLLLNWIQLNIKATSIRMKAPALTQYPNLQNCLTTFKKMGNVFSCVKYSYKICYAISFSKKIQNRYKCL